MMSRLGLHVIICPNIFKLWEMVDQFGNWEQEKKADMELGEAWMGVKLVKLLNYIRFMMRKKKKIKYG